MSGISWCDETWNVTAGCTKIAEGCVNCWAENFAHRLKGSGIKGYGNVVSKKGWTGRVNLLRQNLNKPMKWKKPKRVFVNSMSDLFHPQVPFSFTDEVFSKMITCKKHTYFILTKRPRYAKEYIESLIRGADDNSQELNLSNIWIGVSISTQRDADEMLSMLSRIPLVHLFVSVEPTLENIELTHINLNKEKEDSLDSLTGICYHWVEGVDLTSKNYGKLEWVIVGCESGKNRRECSNIWIESIVNQCIPAKVPVFVKQVSLNGKVRKDINEFPYIGFPENAPPRSIHIRFQQYPITEKTDHRFK